MATLELVTWFNHQRLLEPIGYVQSAEAEQQYYLRLAAQTVEACAYASEPLRNRSDSYC